MDQSQIFDLQIECSCGANEKIQYFCCESKEKFKCEECFVDGAVPIKKFKQGLDKFYKTFLPRVENSFLHLSQTEAAILSIIKNLRTQLEYNTQMNLIKTILEKNFTLTNISDLMKILIPFKNLNLQNQVNIDFKFINEKVLEEIDKKTKLFNQFIMDNFWSAELDMKQFDSLSVDKELSFSGSELIEFENELIICDLENNSLNYLNKNTLVQEYQLNFGKIEEENKEGKLLHQIKKSKDGKFLIFDCFTQFGYIQIPTKKFEIKFSQQVQDKINCLIITDDNTKLFLTQLHGIDIYEISSSKFIKYECSIQKQKIKDQAVPIYAIHSQNKKLYVANLVSTISIYDVQQISENKITLCSEIQLNKLSFNNFLNVLGDDTIYLGNKSGKMEIFKQLNKQLISISELQVLAEENFQNYVMNDNFLVGISKTEIKLYSHNGFQQRMVGNKIFENESLQCGQFSDCGTKLYLLGKKLYIISLYLNIKSVI